MVSVVGMDENPWRIISFMWNCYNLEETNLTRRLKRHGLNSSSNRREIKCPSRGRKQVTEGETFFTACQMESAIGLPFVKL